MKPYFVKTPSLIKFIFKNWVWSFSKREKTIYLTFDDGPTPEITLWVLNELKKYNALATFFCIGKNIKAYPEIFQKIQNQGHAFGNHTYMHEKGFRTTTTSYLESIDNTEELIAQFKSSTVQPKKRLFRPPYGKLTLNQSKKIRHGGYKICMWDVLSADFDTSISNEKCLENVIKHTTNGSIIVFHDSKKASEKLKFVLPKILEYYSKKEYQFKAIA